MAVSKKLVYADMDGFSFEFQWHISFGLPEALSQRAMAAIRVVGLYMIANWHDLNFALSYNRNPPKW